MSAKGFEMSHVVGTEIAVGQFERNLAGSCTACIIEGNRLAAEYLSSILRQDARIDVCFFDQFVNSAAAGVSPLIFCLDQADAVLPLRASLNLLRLSYPESRCILLDTENRNVHLSLLLDFRIHGFLKHANVKEQFLEAVQSVSRGLMWMHPEFTVSIAAQNESTPDRPRPESLTRRENEILHLVTNHFSNKEISMLLEIEESTVKFHLSNILSKCNVSRREDLSSSKISHGWKTLLLAGMGTTNPVLRSMLR
jgi:DNA-binding NarL/FixJ family response regulator